MAIAIHVYIKPKGAADDAPIQVEHIFYAATEEEADKIRLAHLAGCENFALAEAEDRVAEDVEDLNDRDVPTWDEVADDAIDVDGEEVDEGDEEVDE